MNQKPLKRILFSLIALIFVAQMLGCAKPAEQETSQEIQSTKETTIQDEGSSSSESVAYKENLVVGVQLDLDMLDPHNSKLSVVGRMQPLFYETLITKSPTGEYIPCLAEDFEWKTDTEVVFYLRRGIKFHDGNELKASDVKFNIDRLMKTERHVSRYNMIVSIEVIDDYTVKITTETPNDKLLVGLSRVQHGAGMMSEACVIEAGENISQKECGTGPYKLHNWIPGDQMVVERFDDYWGEMPTTKTITYRVITENTSRLIALETGEIDIMEALPITDSEKVQDNPELVFYEIPSVAITYWGFNVSHPPFDNLLVRQAMNYAVDRNEVMSAAGGSKIYQTVLSEGMEGYDNSIVGYPYNPDKARELLEEAGYKDGFECTLYVKSTDSQTMMASQVLQAYAAEVGVTVNLITLESTALFAELYESKHDSYILTASNHDPYTGFVFFYGGTNPQAGNRMFYQNDRLDELYELLPQTYDIDERQEMISEMQQIAVDDAVWVPLYGQSFYAAARKDVQGIRLDDLGWHNYAYAYAPLD